MADELEDVTIRLATPQDADAIIQFLRDHWIIENHVFTRRRDLFDNCHLIDGRLTFLLAEGIETKQIYGILGYSFNNANFDNPDISAVIFQTLKTANASLGIDMIRELQRLTNARCLFCPGILKKTKGLYDFLGYTTGLMPHYYKLGAVSQFKIAQVDRVPEKRAYAEEPWQLAELDTYEAVADAFDFERFADVMPYRDAWSVKQRYFDNIGYDYDVFGIFPGESDQESAPGSAQALLIGRELECNGAKMFKIIDYIGDDAALAHVGAALDGLMAERGYEYADFYEVGIDDDIMRAAGFELRVKNDSNIIPNFFEPYELRNIDIYYYTTWPGKFHIYRTDAGQDRPNFIDEL